MESIYTTIPEFLEALFGHYTPITYQTTSGDFIIPAGLAGVDWTYISSVGLFALIVYAMLRILGGLICKN